MIKRMTLLQRRQGMEFAAFDAHWAGPHAAIAAAFPRLGRYKQNSVRKRPEADRHRLDGIVELWFADAEAMAEALSSPAAAKLPADEPNFLSGITILSVREELLKPGRGAAKVMIVADQDAAAAFSVEAWTADLMADADICGVVANHVESVGARPGLATQPTPPALVMEVSGNDADRLWQRVAAALPTPGTLRASVYSVEERRVA